MDLKQPLFVFENESVFYISVKLSFSKCQYIVKRGLRQAQTDKGSFILIFEKQVIISFFAFLPPEYPVVPGI